MKKIEILDGQVYVGQTEHRRVVGILKERVYYSRGGDTTLSCKRTAFLRWKNKQQAQLVNGERS